MGGLGTSLELDSAVIVVTGVTFASAVDDCAINKIYVANEYVVLDQRITVFHF